jgi:hypothetical protein
VRRATRLERLAKQEDIEMQLERGGHRHVARVAAEHVPEPSAFSLLRLSVPARLVIVSIAAALLWGTVLWALA